MRSSALGAYLVDGCNPGAAQTGDRVADTGSFRHSRPYQQRGRLEHMRVLSRAEVRLLWYAEFWDYPRSGALEWDERRYWFSEAEPETGVFNVMDLTAAQWDVQDAIHQDFQTYVGRHTDFSEPGNRTPIAVSTDLHNARLRPRDQWKNFYERWRDIERPEAPVVAQWKFDTTPLRMSCGRSRPLAQH